MKAIYLDYAATTPVDPEVVEAMHPYFRETFGNPSSIHSFGQQARSAVEDAREKVASSLGAKPAEIVFTSGGTESDNFAIKGIAYANRRKGNHIITTAIEHHAVLEPCHFLEREGFEVTFLPVDSHGLVDPQDVAKAITGRTVLVSVMHANNEIGTLQPIAEIGKIVRERGVCFHTDAVQTFGHVPFTVGDLTVDLLSLSAHKLYGPKGIGALYIRQGVRLEPHMHGGEQEGKRRASTHNVPGIVGLAKAVELAEKLMPEETDRITALRDKLIRGLLDRIDRVRLNGHPEKASCEQRQHLHRVLRRRGHDPEPRSDGHRLLDGLGLFFHERGALPRAPGHRPLCRGNPRVASLQPGQAHGGSRDRSGPRGASQNRETSQGHVPCIQEHQRRKRRGWMNRER